jgi:hypothetical protein
VLTLSRSLFVLTHDATQALRLFLESHGFDLGHPIHVRELTERRGVQRTQ